MVEYFEFLDGGVSPYHVVEQSQEELKKLGFIPLNECEDCLLYTSPSPRD